MSIPNLFLVGAGKSGTSALYEYLSCHSQIYMAPEKELSYFGADLDFRSRRLSLAEYLRFFEGTEDYSYRGDASVQYLLSGHAAAEIKEFSPEAMILILVRNPLEVMHARHAQNVYAGSETIRDFASAVEAEARRRCGLDIPRGVECVNWLYYRDWVRYSEQITRYLNVFGRGRVWLGVYDDLKANPLEVYRSVMRFLKLSDANPLAFKKINVNKSARSFAFQRAVTGRFSTVNRVAKIMVPNRKLRSILQRFLMQANSKPAIRVPVGSELHARLISELRPEVEFLQSLLHRDLSSWLSTPVR